MATFSAASKYDTLRLAMAGNGVIGVHVTEGLCHVSGTEPHSSFILYGPDLAELRMFRND